MARAAELHITGDRGGAAFSLLAAGFVVLRWGAGQAAVVAFVVGIAGLFIGVGSWRTRQQETQQKT